MKINKVKTISIIVAAILYAFIGISFFVFKQDMLIPLAILLISTAVVIFILYDFNTQRKNTLKYIEDNLSSNSKYVLDGANMGVLTYNDDFEIIYLSDLFYKKGINKIGEKILQWLPELKDLLKGESERETVFIDENKYQVSKRKDANTLLFKDITNEYNLQVKLEEDAYVLGLVSIDNYDEYSGTEDDITYINANIKLPLIEYFKSFGVVYKTIRNDRLQLILNQKTYERLIADRFSILNKTRKEAKQVEFDITLSMAFASGSDDLYELDSIAQECLDLAQTRGGDQVVTKVYGHEAVLFGGGSEANQKQSKVKARVMTNSIKRLILEASNVIILGHTDADSDCVGSMLCMSAICNALGKESVIVLKTGGIEAMIENVIEKYEDELNEKHHFVTEIEAINRLEETSLVIMCDHHSSAQSNGANLLKNANRIVIIDHHRRAANLDVEPIMAYVEASASSTSEMLIEFLPYLTRKVDISPAEANIMYLGLLIDTNRFRVRTGVRTFDVAKVLRQYGADPTVCDQLSQEPFENVMMRNDIISRAERYKGNMLISTSSNTYSRAIASQAADDLVSMKEIEAAFVICINNKDEYIVSARSKGNINVSRIMEKLNGGGHMTAAAVQKTNTNATELLSELKQAIDEYLEQEAKENESNTVE